VQVEIVVPGRWPLHAVVIVNDLSVVEVPGMAGLAFTAAGSLKKAAGVKGLLDTGLVRLFKDTLVPTSATTKTEFEAEEADFKGYDGIAVTWSAPILESGGGATIRAAIQYNYNSAAVGGTTSNRIGGCWIEDADGDVWEYFVLPSVVTIEGDGTGLPLTLLDTEGASSLG
jgi:hypothetical protein